MKDKTMNIVESVIKANPSDYAKIFTPEFLSIHGLLNSEQIVQRDVNHAAPDWFQWGINCGLLGYDLLRCYRAGILIQRDEDCLWRTPTPEDAVISFTNGLSAGRQKFHQLESMK